MPSFSSLDPCYYNWISVGRIQSQCCCCKAVVKSPKNSEHSLFLCLWKPTFLQVLALSSIFLVDVQDSKYSTASVHLPISHYLCYDLQVMSNSQFKVLPYVGQVTWILKWCVRPAALTNQATVLIELSFCQCKLSWRSVLVTGMLLSSLGKSWRLSNKKLLPNLCACQCDWRMGQDILAASISVCLS